MPSYTNQPISTMYSLFAGRRQASLAKARMFAEMTGSDILVWMDKDRAGERQALWEKIFPDWRKNG